MSMSCGVGCVVCLGCSRWLWKRCTHAGSDDSAAWPAVDSTDDFAPIPRTCRAILAVYEDDLARPCRPPSPAGYGLDPAGYGLDPAAVVRRADYPDTRGASPPYLVYADHRHREIILALRGLNLAKDSDYKLLLDNSLGRRMFDGGYVHHGLLKSAVWVLKREWETLRELWRSTGCCYKLVFVGHSLGSGVAALMTVLAVNRLDRLGGIPRSLVRCYAIAPARCMSLNLAVKYADVIYSVVLQDDFLPRTPTPLEDIFKSIFCLPCLLFLICLRDTFIPEGRKLRDPRRLYPPGRIYHIVNRKKCRCGRYPPEVRTAIPVDGRFEHIVLSCNTTADHAIIWIEREARKALEVMQNAVEPKKPPEEQRMERKESLKKEHRAALEKAVSLNVPHAMLPEDIEGAEPAAETDRQSIECNTDASILPHRESRSSRTHWDELLDKLFDRDECGNLLLKKDAVITES